MPGRPLFDDVGLHILLGGLLYGLRARRHAADLVTLTRFRNSSPSDSPANSLHG